MSDDALGFGRELDELRREKGLSYDQLAARSGVSATYLKDLVYGRRGQRRPSHVIIEKVAAALDVQPDHFRIVRTQVVLAVAPKAIDQLYQRIRQRGAA